MVIFGGHVDALVKIHITVIFLDKAHKHVDNLTQGDCSDHLIFCMNFSIVGTPFYLTGLVKGRIYKDYSLSDLPKQDRWAIFEGLVDVLAKVHKVDVDKAGLSDYGKKGTVTFHLSHELMKWILIYCYKCLLSGQ